MSGAACARLSPTAAKNAAAHNDDHERLIDMMALSRLFQRQFNPISSAWQQPGSTTYHNDHRLSGVCVYKLKAQEFQPRHVAEASKAS
jgi:hypothetical protein